MAAAVEAEGALEDVRQGVGGDAFPGVRHFQPRPVALALPTHRDPPAGRRVLDGVIQQVAQDLGDPELVTEHAQTGGTLRRHPLPGGADAGLSRRPFDHLLQIDRPALQHQAAFDLSQQQQIRHQPAHPCDLLDGLADALLARLLVADPAQQVQVGTDRQQRVAQLVGSLGQELAMRPQGVLDLVEQLVHHAREPADFIAMDALEAQAAAEVALGGDLRSLRRDGAEGVQPAIGHEPAGRAGQHHGQPAQAQQQSPQTVHGLPQHLPGLHDAQHGHRLGFGPDRHADDARQAA